MSFKEQLNKLKENWLVILLVIIALLVFSTMFSGNFSNLNLDMASSKMMADSYESYSPSMNSYGGENYYSNDFAPEVVDRKIIKNSSLSLEVKGGSFFQTHSKIKSIVSSTDSLILNENINSNNYNNKESYYGSYSIKVESSKLDFLVSQLKDLGKVTYFSERTNDVTGSYTNKEIELNVERERLKRYQEMYTEADKISDKIDLNDRIFNQERTIKYLEDSLKNIDQKIEYSTVTLNLSEKYNYTNIVFVKFTDLLRSLVKSINTILKIIFVLIPFAIIGYIIYLIKRKKKDVVIKKR